MNQVRCNKCGKSMALEDARARGGVYKGFVCPACFRQQAKVAWTVGSVIFVLVMTIRFFDKNENPANSADLMRPGLESLSNASYEQAGVSTNVQEIPSPAHVGNRQEYQLGWGKHLFTPLDKDKLRHAGFGYTDDLFTPGSTGGILKETATSRTIGVRGGSRRFEVTQTRSP